MLQASFDDADELRFECCAIASVEFGEQCVGSSFGIGQRAIYGFLAADRRRQFLAENAFNRALPADRAGERSTDDRERGDVGAMRQGGELR